MKNVLLTSLIGFSMACAGKPAKKANTMSSATNEASSGTAGDLKGTVIVTERGPVRIHSYVSPSDSFLVNTHIVEGPTKLIVFDGQATKPYAEEVATYLHRLGKPVDRIILSHGHPDHWSGFEVLTARLPGVPIYALPDVTSFVRAAGPGMLGNLQHAFGNKAASEVTLPTRVLETGTQTIDGVRFELSQFADGEANFQLVALMPDQRVMLAFDLVFAATDHMFTVQPTFDSWVAILERLKAFDGYDRILLGHDAPSDRSAFDASIAYLQRAKEIHAREKDGRAYAAGLKAAFPNRGQTGWADFSGMILYR